MTSGRTNDVTSIRGSPVAASMSISRTLSSVAMTSGSFWNPSRGPTSRMRTSCGISLILPALGRLDHADFDHASLVSADADRALALAHLDLESELAPVDHLTQGRAHRAGRT